MNILVLAGGISTERDVSLKSGEMIAKALQKQGHMVILADVFLGADDGTSFERQESIKEYRIASQEPDIAAIKKKRGYSQDGFFGKNILRLAHQADIVFLALHGEDGENGKIQATFDLLDIAYTGNDSLSCALAMDKSVAKKIFMEAKIPTPRGKSFSKEEWEENPSICDMPFPIVVKPACGGSSIGVSIVQKEDELPQALESVFLLEDTVIVEEYIRGREFSVGVIAEEALPVIEIAPLQGFYNYANKYAAGQTKETCPANLPEDVAREMQTIALDVTKALGLEVYSRMDFLLEEHTNQIYCLEANTLPGMTPTSLIPQEAQAAGIAYEPLCEKIIELSIQKRATERNV